MLQRGVAQLKGNFGYGFCFIEQVIFGGFEADIGEVFKGGLVKCFLKAPF